MSESAAKLKAWIVELSTENKTQQAVIEERGYMIESLKSDNARLTAENARLRNALEKIRLIGLCPVEMESYVHHIIDKALRGE